MLRARIEGRVIETARVPHLDKCAIALAFDNGCNALDNGCNALDNGCEAFDTDGNFYDAIVSFLPPTRSEHIAFVPKRFLERVASGERKLDASSVLNAEVLNAAVLKDARVAVDWKPSFSVDWHSKFVASWINCIPGLVSRSHLRILEIGSYEG
jgi:hypothetical protein